MTPEEKIYMRRLITQLYYQGDIDGVVSQLCTMVGWYPVDLGGRLPESQIEEIDYFLKSGRLN